MQTKPKRMITLQNSGNYCDPVTGECFSDQDKETKMTTRIDPVCKMEVEVETAQYSTEYNGEKYVFCSPGCLQEFEENPAHFVPAAPQE
jgi:YHS domain-containing protein